jgi:hypothetical protein
MAPVAAQDAIGQPPGQQVANVPVVGAAVALGLGASSCSGRARISRTTL